MSRSRSPVTPPPRPAWPGCVLSPPPTPGPSSMFSTCSYCTTRRTDWRGGQRPDRMGRGVNPYGGDQEGRSDVECIRVARRAAHYHHRPAGSDRPRRAVVELTSYDVLTAGIFEQAGVRALLVGDTSAELVLAYGSTLPVTMTELISMTRAVVAGTRTALVVADLPFGSYQAGPEVALANAVRHLKEGGAQAVKLEGGRRVLPQVEIMVGAGIPVMGHLGLTPQSINVLGGVRRVQGRGDAGDELLADALALEAAGAFAVVLESVPAALGRRVSDALRIPTVGIGAGPEDRKSVV